MMPGKPFNELPITPQTCRKAWQPLAPGTIVGTSCHCKDCALARLLDDIYDGSWRVNEGVSIYTSPGGEQHKFYGAPWQQRFIRLADGRGDMESPITREMALEYLEEACSNA